MRIELHVFQEGSPATVTFNFDFKKQYKNNDNAIKWIEVPCALFANEAFIIQELSKFPLNLTSPLQSLEDNNYECFKRYYKDIKRIELAIGKNSKSIMNVPNKVGGLQHTYVHICTENP